MPLQSEICLKSHFLSPFLIIQLKKGGGGGGGGAFIRMCFLTKKMGFFVCT